MAVFDNENDHLTCIESAHTARSGAGNFCYVAIPLWGRSTELYQLAVTARDLDGYVPISEDWFLGDVKEMHAKAAELNASRLNLAPLAAVRIVAESMTRARKRSKA
jgi:hypothetical protein